jgi:RNA polymerase sigma factor (sigma-70 family)
LFVTPKEDLLRATGARVNRQIGPTPELSEVDQNARRNVGGRIDEYLKGRCLPSRKPVLQPADYAGIVDAHRSLLRSGSRHTERRRSVTLASESATVPSPVPGHLHEAVAQVSPSPAVPALGHGLVQDPAAGARTLLAIPVREQMFDRAPIAPVPARSDKAQRVRVSVRETTVDDPPANKKLHDRFVNALNSLPFKDRDALLLCYVDRLGIPEIAALLEIGPENVIIRLRRAMARLREMLGSAVLAPVG